MSLPRKVVDGYMQASENLMKLEDLTDVEIEAVEKMLVRISAMLISQRDNEP